LISKNYVIRWGCFSYRNY